MSETIEEQIRQRQEEGNALFHPAKMLALHLGERHPKKHGSIMIFKGGLGESFFEIHYDTFAPNLSVYDRSGNSILYFHLGKIERYKRGPWVTLLQTMVRPVLRKIEREKTEQAKKKEHERLEDWGLA